MSSRYFEFVGGNSAKFWEVGVRGSQVTVRYGRIGTQGQTLNKQFDDPGMADRHVQKLIAQKRAKGYAETAAC